MAGQLQRRSFKALLAALILGASTPIVGFASTDAHNDAAKQKIEQSGMSWVEYIYCVVTIKDDSGSWSNAAQDCLDDGPTDPPDGGDIPLTADMPTQRRR